MLTVSTTTIKAPKFLRTLYAILHFEPQDILAWSRCGSYFQVFDVHRLETLVLPRYFKHNKFASFQRQLNNFGFRKWTKTRASVCTFSHDSMSQCHPSELENLMQTQIPVEPAMPHMVCAGRKRQRSDIEATLQAPKKTKTHALSHSEIPSTDVSSLDWSVFFGEDVLTREDAVGLPLEFLFPDEKSLNDVEPLALSEDVSMAETDWQLLADCLTSCA